MDTIIYKNSKGYIKYFIRIDSCKECGESYITNKSSVINGTHKGFCSIKCSRIDYLKNPKNRELLSIKQREYQDRNPQSKGKDSPRYNKIEYKCDYCRETKLISPSNYNNHDLHFCNKECEANYRLNTDYNKGNNSPLWKRLLVKCDWCSIEFEKKRTEIRDSNHNYCSPECYANHSAILKRGENSYRWKGGITPLRECIRKSKFYVDWRTAIFERDKYICQKCNVKGGHLEAHHHIKPFAVILEEHNIKTFEDALNCSELWDINYGITFCKKCHNETKGGRKRQDKIYKEDFKCTA